MKKLFQWLSDNSAALQGLAAVVVIIGTIAAGTVLVARWFKPEVVLRLNPEESTIPSDLVEWIQGIASNLRDRSPVKANTEPEKELKRLAESAITGRLVNIYNGIDRFSIDVRNQTDRVISGVRVRLEGIREIWSVQVRGTFLTDQEALTFIKQIGPLQRDVLVLPELPPLPPGSTLRMILYGYAYGSAEYIKAEISVQGASARVENMVKVEDAWPIYLYQHPELLGFLVFFMAMVAVLVWSLSSSMVEKFRERKK